MNVVEVPVGQLKPSSKSILSCKHCQKKFTKRWACRTQIPDFCSMKCYALWQSLNRHGENSFSFGRHLSKAQREKLSFLNRGEKHPQAKLIEQNILDIRKMAKTG